ncbi:MAG: flagellar FliJ family protein [Gracilibacteraceae bacterium]|jgi:flagellar FliJ protein|nr:flagellar FliJ family protein [Gracilibacteraceae bacterium]
MKKFNFSLDSVLRVKEQLLTVVQTELARLNEAIARQEEAEAENRRRNADNDRQCAEEQAKGIDPRLMICYADYRERLYRQLREIQRKKTALFRDRDNVIEKTIALKVEIAALEKLRENELLVYQAGIRKEEERVVDEFIGFRRVANGV